MTVSDKHFSIIYYDSNNKNWKSKHKRKKVTIWKLIGPSCQKCHSLAAGKNENINEQINHLSKQNIEGLKRRKKSYTLIIGVVRGKRGIERVGDLKTIQIFFLQQEINLILKPICLSHQIFDGQRPREYIFHPILLCHNTKVYFDESTVLSFLISDVMVDCTNVFEVQLA